MKPQSTNLFSCFQHVMGTAALAAIATTLSATGASAVTFGASAVSANNAGDVAIGESQLFVDITDAGSNRVLFKFSNLGPAASAITQIYFDDDDASPYLLQTGVILSDSDPIGGTGVRYQNLALGGNLPDSNNSMPGGGDFDEDFNFVPQSAGGASNNGIGVNEWAGFEFALAGSQTFAGLLDAIANGSFFVGFHVQAFASGGSESFINNPTPTPDPTPTPTPEPTPDPTPTPTPTPEPTPDPTPTPTPEPTPDPTPTPTPTPEPTPDPTPTPTPTPEPTPDPTPTPTPEPTPDPTPTPTPTPEPTPDPTPTPTPTPEPTPDPTPTPTPDPVSTPEPASIAGLIALGAALRTMKRHRNDD
jgi:hypothetical protein